MRTYTEEEIAAEEERFGGRLPDELRRRYQEGINDEIVVRLPDGTALVVYPWAPSTITSDKKGREYPTPGMAKETEEARELLPDGARVAWAGDGDGNLGLVMDDDRLVWWWHDGDPDDALDPVEVDWDPSPETFEALMNGEEDP